MTLHHTVRQQLLGNLTQPQPDEAAQLNNALMKAKAAGNA